VESSYSDDILTDIVDIRTKLRQKGFERIIVVDLTRSDANIPTVRVIVPGMEVFCFDKTRRGERLYR
jgi:ribosomal protein S12 methylthiotransferase accessory factor